MADVEVKGRKYVTGKLNARQQFHVARRLAPLISAMAEAVGSGKAAVSEDAALSMMAGPIATALAKMPEADCDYVIDACLKSCQRVQEAGSLAPVIGRGGIMFEDMDMADLTQIAVATVQENLGSFFGVAPQRKS